MLPDSARLPQPDAEALAHSGRLTGHLRAIIEAHGGWLDFAQFMNLLLHAPGLGYYSAGSARFQHAGDFTTAPETGPLFGRTLARAIAPVLRHVAQAELIEPGAGTGRLAEVLLPALEVLDALPERYAILETSAALRAEQQARLARLPAHLERRVEWLDALPSRWQGVLLANEVLDAMPVHRLHATPDGLYECGVCVDAGGGFAWAERPAQAPLERAVAGLVVPPLAGSRFELGLQASAWARTVAERLAHGAVVLVDYGDPARALHQPHRLHGTLRCFYRHHVHDDPFFLPGLQDVTAHVDFTAVGLALRQAGLQLHDYASQASFLMAHGLLQVLDTSHAPGSLGWLRQTREVQTLVSPAEMGESFKVLVGLRDPDGSLASQLPGAGEAAVAMQLGIPE